MGATRLVSVLRHEIELEIALHRAIGPRLQLFPADKFDAPTQRRGLPDAWPLRVAHQRGEDG